MGYRGGWKLLWPSQAPEVGTAHHHWGSCDHALPATTVTPGIVTAEDPATEHCLLSPPPWECTLHVAAAVKGPGHGPHLLMGSHHRQGLSDQILPTGTTIVLTSLELHAGLTTNTHNQGDNGQHPVGKETASIQNKSSPHTKKKNH